MTNQENGWAIPGDWNGDGWQCIKIMWPASEKWQRLLVSLLYTLTRGREWDAASGNIRDTQAIGWRIWDANVPLVACDGGDDATTPATIEYRGSSLVVIGEDDMGQVVTEVYADYTTGELVVKYGMCCEKRFPLALNDVPGNEYGDVDAPPPVPDFPPDTFVMPDTSYYACGKAQTLVERIDAISHAAWNNRELPFTMASAIQAANPGYSLSMVNVTNLYLVGLSLSAIEALTDADIFNQEFLDAWTCFIASKTSDGEAKGLSKLEFLEAVNWPVGYAFTEGVPDLDIVIDLRVANWYFTIMQLVLGHDRCEQIMAEAIGIVGDCPNCQSSPEPDTSGPTDPLASGYYLGPNLAGGVGEEMVHWTGGTAIGYSSAVPENCYGVLMSITPTLAYTHKRMSWSYEARMAAEPDVSMWGNTSDNLQNEGFNGGVPLVFFADEVIGQELAQQIGFPFQVWKDAGTLDVVVIAASDSAGARIDILDEGVTPALVQFRWIFKDGA